MKSYKYKLYKTKKQRHLHKRVYMAGRIYNHIIALHKRYYRMTGKYISKYRMTKHIAKMRRRRFPEWGIVGSQAIQNIVFRIDFGYQKFFKKENKRPPTFRKSSKFKSFTLTQAGWELGDGCVIIGKKKFKYFDSRPIEGAPKQLHVKRDALGDFYIIVVTDFCEEPKERVKTGKIAGFDFGLKVFLTSSDGNDIESPQFFKQNVKLLKKASKNLSSKQVGSKNRKKAKKQLSRIHRRIKNQRDDWQWKTAKHLADKYDFLFFEDLNLSGMKALWGRKVSDLSLHSFMVKLDHQCKKSGSINKNIDRWNPSTKTCSTCGCINNAIMLDVREWDCPHCESHHNRDRNASYNILSAGASAVGLGDVRHGCSHAVAV